MAAITVYPVQAWMLDRLTADSEGVVLIRADVALPAQDARLVSLSQGGRIVTVGADTITATVELVGYANLDVRRGDRFTLGGLWYEVVQAETDLDGAIREAPCVVMQ